MFRIYVFQCSFHAGCWKYTLSHHRGPCFPIHCPNHERSHLKPQRLDMTWVYCLGCISLPSVPSQGIHRSYGLGEDCRTLLKVQSLWRSSKPLEYYSFCSLNTHYYLMYIILCPNKSQVLDNIMIFIKYSRLFFLFFFKLNIYLYLSIQMCCRVLTLFLKQPF